MGCVQSVLAEVKAQASGGKKDGQGTAGPSSLKQASSTTATKTATAARSAQSTDLVVDANGISEQAPPPPSASTPTKAVASVPIDAEPSPTKAGKSIKFAEEQQSAKIDADGYNEEEANSPAKKEITLKKRTQSWRTSAKRSVRSVNYEGDKAEDKKDSEAKTALALKAKRRGDVFVEHIDLKDRYSLAVISKTDEQRENIEEALAENMLFADLGDDELTMMVATMKSNNTTAGEKLITQGEQGDNFFVVDAGVYAFLVDGVEVGQAKRGSSFGELALLYNTPRAATVVCLEPGMVWVLPRQNFRKIVSSSVTRGRTETARALKSVKLLSEFTDSQIDALVDCTTTIRFEPGDTVIRKGDDGRVFYFIKTGEVMCTKIGSGDDNANLNLGPGEYFGERALMTNEKRAANVIATTELECIALDKDDFESHLGSYLDRLDRNLGARVLKSLPMFAELSDQERDKLTEEFAEEKYNAGDYIVKQGEQGSKFYIVRDGQCEVSKRVGDSDERVTLATLSNGDFFGEGALLREEPRGADIVALGSCRVFSLEKEDFDRSMAKLKNHLSHHLSLRMDKTDDAVKAKKKTAYGNIQMHELEILHTLGTGTFGRVKLVHHPKLKKAFALKQLQKTAVVKYRQQENVMSEKTIMENADHPFILRLHKTFKDQDCLYMLLEFVQGGELFTLLHVRGGKLADKDARFYAACVQDALEYLHDQDIVYRDLKPENLLIDDAGYIRVVDFGFSKKITTRSFTLCGTPEYLAPELVLGKGHAKGVDIWALGVLIFEMIAGVSPFADLINNDHMAICKKIVRNKVEFPKRFSEKAKDLVSKLLVREPHLRIGCLAGGHLDIKGHAYFKGLDYNELCRKRIKAPWTPEIKDYLDTSAFEEFDEGDRVEPFLEDDSWSANF